MIISFLHQERRMDVLHLFLLGMVLFLFSCSSDYVNVIPAGSTAVVSLDLPKMAEQSSNVGADKTAALKALLHVNDLSDCGISLSDKAYAFETSDGSLGLVLKVSDASDLEDWFMSMSKTGISKEVTERKGFKFTVIHDNFVAGFSSDALLIMGPSVGAAQAELQRKMIKYLKADEDAGISGSRLFERLETMSSPVCMVAQAQALPDKFVAPFTLGAPKGTPAADIYIAAEMNVDKNGCLAITGENFSFNSQVDKALQEASKSYKPISQKFLASISSDAMFAMACGIKGEDYIQKLRGNDAFRSILLGLNSAIDIDQMLKGIDGDMLIVVPTMNGDKLDFQLVASTANTQWLGDVDYWKTSCPSGSKIVDWTKPNTYHFVSADWNVYFGVNESKELFFGSSENLAASAGKASQTPIPTYLQQTISGKRLCAVVNIGAMAESKPEMKTVTDLLTPFFGHLNTIIYSLK